MLLILLHCHSHTQRSSCVLLIFVSHIFSVFSSWTFSLFFLFSIIFLSLNFIYDLRVHTHQYKMWYLWWDFSTLLLLTFNRSGYSVMISKCRLYMVAAESYVPYYKNLLTKRARLSLLVFLISRLYPPIMFYSLPFPIFLYSP